MLATRIASIAGRTLRGLNVYLVVLNPGPDVALARGRARPEKTVTHLWVHMEDALQRQLAGLGFWVDSAGLDVEATVELILRRRAGGLLATGGC